MCRFIGRGNQLEMTDARPNRLIAEKSPYLLQHEYNPVDWYPWSHEAFERATREDKPIFLSIGYSTCHWCHVMEDESFEDTEVAELMNETFISIKVDREERPDLDNVYMTVCQILTGSGGWPLNIVMTPDKRPFFAATYLPRESRFGRTGMKDLIPRIKEVWNTRRGEVIESGVKIIAALRSMEKDSAGGELDKTVLEKAYQELTKRFDREYGGFSDAPKFPTPHNFLFMLRYWKRFKDETALEMVEKTLEAMRQGGIYDQVGYGFHRYSIDREWLVPHFEKMLYDQALLAMVYLEAFQTTGKEIYGSTAREILDYVMRDMRAPEGAFYSAEDADSEGEEGKFYLWKEEEIRQILDRRDADLVISVFNVERSGNFKEETNARKSEANILHIKKPLSKIASELKMPVKNLENRITSARERLFEAREQRIHPHKDDKILTDWNGLMIAAFAQGARVLGKATYADEARRAADFILGQMRTADGRLLHRYRDGDARIAANLNDYSFFIWGLIELYEATFETQYLERALELNRDMLAHFWDESAGGLFFTPEDGERLIVRKKEVYDGALPSGNSVALYNLLRLARVTGDVSLDEKAARIVKAFSGHVAQFPSGYTQFLISIDFGIGPSYEAVIAGAPGAVDTIEMLRAINIRYIPNLVVIFRPSDQKSPDIDKVAGFIRNYVSIEGKATAYVCLRNMCKAPTTDIEEMLELLK